jgi:hypothetical protein
VALASRIEGVYAEGVAWFALVTSRSPIAVDIYRSREQADEELRQAVDDEPDWVDSLTVVRVDLPEPCRN